MRPFTEILDNENILFRLNGVSFTRVEDEPDGNNELIVDDSFEISEKQENMFGVKLSRHVFFAPAAFFDIRIEFEVGRCVLENAEEKLTDYDLSKIITHSNVDEITCYNFNRASALIADLTSGFGLNPLITPPVYSNNLVESE